MQLTITTERLELREYEEKDWEAVHAYASDPETVRYCNFGPSDEQESRGFVRVASACRYEVPRRVFELAIVRRSDGRLIGGCRVFIKDRNNRSAEIGYIIHKDCWGQGYATEAARALLDLAFGPLRMHRVFARCDARNTPSMRVMEKIGMVREGMMREDTMQHGEWRDTLMYSILEHEWRGMREQDRSDEARL